MRTPSPSSPSPEIENCAISNPSPAAGISQIGNPNPETEIESPNPHSVPEPEIETPNPDFIPGAEIENPNPNPDSRIDNFSPEADIEKLNPNPDSEEVSGNPNPKKASFSLWNAVVKFPMRRLQERILGSRWGSTTEASRSSIWLLGVCYSLCEEGSSAGGATSTEAYADFQTDYSSRIWFTYRKGFEALGPTKWISDGGWGCMLRSGQMLLAQALVCHHLGRHWRRKPSEPNAREYLKILQCFGDSASQDCPFSIHNILEVGDPYGLVAGSWLGPYAFCRSLEVLARNVRESSENNKLERKLPMEVYVVSGDADGERGGAPCICIDDVKSLCSNTGGSVDEWAPILLLVPLVLGPEIVNSRYLPSLWATFTFPQSLGIMGGKPRASTYLVGVQDDQVLYLDPHEVQQAVIVSPDNLEVDTSSYHCSMVKKMPLNAIDPSLALGFYCRDRGDFEDLCKRASELARESNGAPMFTVAKTSNKGGGQRGDSVCVETDELIILDEGHAPSEEDWQIL